MNYLGLPDTHLTEIRRKYTSVDSSGLPRPKGLGFTP